MTTPVKLDRRAVLKGIAGASLALPVLEARARPGGRGRILPS